MPVVAVTGVAGFLGQRLLRRLAADPSVERIVGIDARDPRFRPGKLEFHRADIATAELKALLDGVEALAHLAFLVAPQHDEALMARINVEGTRRVLDAAGAAGVTTVVYVSSAMAYGAWPNNPLPLTEDAPLRPNPGFTYALHKAETERLAGEWRDEHPAAAVALLRPVTVVGADADNWVTRVFRDSPLRVRDARPPVQYVHEDDVAAAIHLALTERLDGVFNLAPDGWIEADEARAIAARRPQVRLPEGLVRRVTATAWRLGLGQMPPEAVPWLVHPWVVANDRLRAAGWEPAHSNEEALVAAVEPGPWQGLSSGRRQALALSGALAGVAAAAAGTVAVVRRVRARRR